jgi:hypothetical protein
MALSRIFHVLTDGCGVVKGLGGGVDGAMDGFGDHHAGSRNIQTE